MSIKNSLFYFILSILFIQSCSSQKETKRDIDKYQKTELNALQIILKNDCLQCHSLEDKVVGPPYLDISRRYKERPEIKNTLVNKIMEGGGGLWYGGMMSGHPLLKKGDVNKIVTWILSLDEKHNEYNSAKLEEEIKIELTKGIEQKDQQGALLEVFNLDNPISSFTSFEKNTEPAYTSKVKNINLNGNLLSTELEAPNVLKFSGNIKITQNGKYFFRLQKTGQGQVYLDQKSIISNTENDNEIALDMIQGDHALTVFYSALSPDDVMSFSWIKPGDEYYSLISFD